MGDRCSIAAEPFSEPHPWTEFWMIGGLPNQHLVGRVTCGSLEVPDHSVTFGLVQENSWMADLIHHPSTLSPDFLTSLTVVS